MEKSKNLMETFFAIEFFSGNYGGKGSRTEEKSIFLSKSPICYVIKIEGGGVYFF